jgi:hypothetical protein
MTSRLYLSRGAPDSVPAGTNKKAWPEPELCRFQRDRISKVFAYNKSSQWEEIWTTKGKCTLLTLHYDV